MTDSSKAVFLSYASQDAEAAARICKALRAAGIEVWFDQSELRGGDAWDATIRQQIRACALFVPIISAHTRARAEGYFRLEWKLAVDRSYLIAADKAFLVPIVIDSTRDNDARVPDRFREVQWTSLPSGDAPPAFVARITRLLSHDEYAAAPEETVPGSGASSYGQGDRKSRRAVVGWIIGGVSILLIGAILAFPWIWQHPRDQSRAVSGDIAAHPAIATSRIAGKLRLAILPFENLSPDRNDSFFADGLHEEIISTIAEHLHKVEVISRTTMISDWIKAKPVATVASMLGATHLIEGSVRREGRKIRVTLQLIDAATDERTWSKSYDRTLTSALTLQSEVANEVASQLAVQLSAPLGNARPPTEDVEAHDLYLKAVLALRSIEDLSPEYFRKVDDLLTRAIRRDPAFALAYAQRARAKTLAYIIGYNTSERQLQGIRDDLDNARRLAPNEPIAQAALGYYLLAVGENARALANLEAADAAGLSDPVWLVPEIRLLLRMSRVEDAIRVNRRMLELDPGNPVVIAFAADTLVLVRRPADALRVLGLGDSQSLYVQFLKTRLVFAFTGQTGDWRRLADRIATQPGMNFATDPGAVEGLFELLRFEHRYQELSKFLQLVPASPVPFEPSPFEIYDMALGSVPKARYQGWVDLLLGDLAGAARAGHALLEFVATQKGTKRNAFFLHRLAAEGYLFAGQPKQAIQAATASLELVPRSRDAVSWIGAAQIAARIYAWAGAHKESDALLAQLATVTPGLPQAEITRDPLYSVPLVHDGEYLALVGRLEVQMNAMKLH